MLEDETYESACVRAELLGTAPPNKEEFEKARAERLQKQAEEHEAAEANQMETDEETMKNIGGKLDELNAILSSTHKKINRIKDSARGSITNIFNRGSVDITDSEAPSGSGSRRNTNASCSAEEHEQAQSVETQDSSMIDGEIQPIIPTEKIRQAKLDIQKKMSSHLDKLDMLVSKAENAEISMNEQTKHMRKMTK